MSAFSVKDRLLNKITSIKDEQFLNELEEIILNLSNDSSDELELNNAMMDSIEKSEQDIKTGKIISNEKAMTHLKEWLKRNSQ